MCDFYVYIAGFRNHMSTHWQTDMFHFWQLEMLRGSVLNLLKTCEGVKILHILQIHWYLCQSTTCLSSICVTQWHYTMHRLRPCLHNADFDWNCSLSAAVWPHINTTTTHVSFETQAVSSEWRILGDPLQRWEIGCSQKLFSVPAPVDGQQN